MSKDEALQLVTDYLDEIGMWTSFVEHIEKMGYTEQEFEKATKKKP